MMPSQRKTPRSLSHDAAAWTCQRPATAHELGVGVESSRVSASYLPAQGVTRRDERQGWLRRLVGRSLAGAVRASPGTGTRWAGPHGAGLA